MSDILRIEDLVIQYDTDSGCVHALNGLSLTLREGETLGLVGETGAGKTTLARSIMGLIQCPPGKIVSGKILYRGEDLLTMKEKHLQSIRGKEISMIFQDPMTSLNPVTTVGDQIAEAVMAHEKIGKKQAWEKALEMLETVGISRERASDYPHQFSGGMKQRVIIAIALVLNPKNPKNIMDKSGSGIGLEQVNRRLEILYPGQYTWQKGISEDGKEYKSRLSIRVRESINK